MIVNYFNNTKPVNFIFLSILLAFVVGFSLYSQEISLSITAIFNIVFSVLTFALFYFSSKDKVLSSKNDFGILFYVLLSSLFIDSFHDLHKTVSYFFVLLGLQQLYALQHKNVLAKKKLFNNGLFFGVAAVFYPLSIVFILLTYVANLIFNKITWRMFVIPIIGFITPIFFIFVLDDLFSFRLTTNLTFLFQLENALFLKPANHYFIAAFIFILTVFSILNISSNLNSKLFFYKQYHALVILFLIIALFLLFFTPNKNGSETIFIIYPLSILFANYIAVIQKKWISNFIIISLLFVVVLKNTLF